MESGRSINLLEQIQNHVYSWTGLNNNYNEVKEMNTYSRLTQEQRRVSMNNRNHRWKEICGSYKGIKGYVLHHVDVTMINNDPERYIEWRAEDLKMMSKRDHLRLHHCGLKYSDETKEKMRQKKLGIPKSEEHRKHLSESHKRYWARRKLDEQVRSGRAKLSVLKRQSPINAA